jgi:hypothetical protein
MRQPCYIDLEQARHVLAEMGVQLTPQQMKRAADKDAHGRRKLPFFIDPIEGTLKIEKPVASRSPEKSESKSPSRLLKASSSPECERTDPFRSVVPIDPDQ